MAGVSCDYSTADENKQSRMEVDVSELSKDENDVSIQCGGNQCGAESRDHMENMRWMGFRRKHKSTTDRMWVTEQQTR